MAHGARILLVFLAAVLLPALAWGNTPERVALGQDMQWFADQDNAYPNLETVLHAESRIDWRETQGDGISRGFNSTPHWFRIRVPPVASARATTRYLQIPEPLLNRIEVFVVRNGEALQHETMGINQPFPERPLEHRDFITPVSLSETEPTRIYLRIQTNGSLQVAPALWTPEAFAEQDRTDAVTSGIFYGVMLVMFLYNLFIYFVVRDRSYLHYIGYVAMFTLFMGALHGDAFQYIWPYATAWQETSVTFSVAALGIASILFTNSFLKLRRHWPLAHRVFSTMLAASVLLVVLSFVLAYEISIRINSLYGILIMLSILAVSIRMWWVGYRHARYFVMAWLALILGTMALALSKFGLLPWNAVTANGAQIGAVMEVVLLSFALGDRINHERAERFQAQQKALAAAEEAKSAQEELLEAKEAANQELEERVRERTRELEQALKKLETVNQFLEEVSRTDQLTGLHNRHHFVRRYHEEYKRAQRNQYPLSVILMDIDHFKWFNDTYGHIAGDECLKAVSEALARIISRAGDTLARYGGEEFIVLLSNTPMEGALVVAERLRRAVSDLALEFDGRTVPVTISAGVAVLTPANLKKPEQLIQNADEALYAAKEQGRNRVCRYPDDVTG
ncbi:diguanylate cyclase [Halospina denitrificans]|uniref:diguanylate cyclase n=1 Tax=Halospina denitrificans TaxID=332522 RepID=A0A4R7JY94_9GAMM|nr:diguanylate cyclase [Halospina denitrificans]TDT43480.1 diguanylate cyclase [Halospina denitrificans]